MQIMRFVVFFIQEYLYSNILASPLLYKFFNDSILSLISLLESLLLDSKS